MSACGPDGAAIAHLPSILTLLKAYRMPHGNDASSLHALGTGLETTGGSKRRSLIVPFRSPQGKELEGRQELVS
jgi:hypothetical protein